VANKGISPILGAVLLFAVTVSVVGIFANFAPNLISSATQGTQARAESQIKCEGAGLSFEGVNFDSSASEVNVNIRNTGNSRLTNVTVVAFSANELLVDQKEDITAFRSNISTVTLSNLGGREPEFVQAFSGECGSIEIREEL
jgi:flagellin-like protein